MDNFERLTFSSIRKAAGEYLRDKEIKAILARRDLIPAWLDPPDHSTSCLLPTQSPAQ